MKELDIKAELEFCGEFVHGVDCTIDNLPWRGWNDSTRGMACVSHETQAAIAFCSNSSVSWAGKPMSCTINQKSQELFVKRAVFTGVHPSGGGNESLETEARLFEFSKENPMPVSGKFRVVVCVEGLQAPSFQDYFGKVGDGDERVCISVDFPPIHFVGNGIEFNYHGCRYLVCTRSEATGQPRHQLIVETWDKIDYDAFCSAVRQILCVIGFFTGCYCFGPFWIFDADTHEFLAYNDCISKACRAKYRMFSTNPLDYFSEKDKSLHSIKTFAHQLIPFSKRNVEALLELLDDEKFSDMFYVFQDLALATQSMTVAVNCVVYAACLEMCAGWMADKIHRENSEDIYSMFSPEERKPIADALKTFLEEQIQEPEKLQNAKNKMWGIFDRPNKDKLCIAFERGGVTLTEEDRNAISTRNKLMHGGNIIEMPSNTGKLLSCIEDAEEKCFQFHSLIWRFIMTSIGYDGQYIDCQKLGKLFRASKSNGGRPLIKDVKTGKEL